MSRTHKNTDAIRQQYSDVAHAVHGLGKLGIEVKFISFKKADPLIVVATPNTDKLQGKVLGGGINLDFNKQYLQIGVLYRDCRVQWRKYRQPSADNWECACENPSVETLHCTRCNNKNLIREKS